MTKRKQKLAIIGDPVAHSVSPQMQNAVLRLLKLPFVYEKIQVRPKALKKFMKGKARKLVGFNVTIPHKEKLLTELDWISPQARLIGAVNTVVRRGKKLLGFNTDGDGYLESLRVQAKFFPRKKKIVLLGAGGAARSIAVALAQEGAAKILIANRTSIKAHRLSQALARHFPKVGFSSSPLQGVAFERSLRDSHLVVNTTSVGLGNSSFKNFPWEKIRRSTLISDIVYKPLMTPWLRQAKRHGHPIHRGEGMLVYQGALSFLLWTGHEPDIRLMYRVALKSLKR
jgi:shikimate dehydrogenase